MIQVEDCVSMAPSMIDPLIDKENREYYVRTMLDSGSESNWISEGILQFIKHTKLDSVKLKVRHFYGETTKKFSVVQIYISSGGRKPVRDSLIEISKVFTHVNCLVYDSFFHHRIVYGLKDYIKKSNVVNNDICDRIVDPTDRISHKDINMGTALILSNSGKFKLMNGKTLYLKTLN